MTRPGFLSLSLILILTLAGGLRLTLVWLQHSQLSEDRDAYIAIARNLAAGNGFSSSNPENQSDIRPTAFRPPLYPCLLALIYSLQAGSIGVGIVQVILGVLTVWLTWKTGTALELKRSALIAAAIVATDPVLLQYTTYSMTEVLAAFLTSLLLYLLTKVYLANLAGETRLPLTFGTGIVWGLAILCRPTYLAFFGVWLVWCCITVCWRRIRNRQLEGKAISDSRRLALFSAGILLMLSPWVVRNLLVFHAPILTTTHGGYTLLLGNNPVFYQKVVQKPWGTVWSGESLDAWQKSLERDLALTDPPLITERERDRWMYQRAKQNISEHPGLFIQSCLLRLKRFWNVAPLTQGTLADSSLIAWGVAGYYTFILIGCLAGTILAIWKAEKKWEPFIWLLFSFTLVHLFYWTNMRMRAPLVPAIALLSVFGWSQLTRIGKFRSAPERAERARPKE